MQDAIDDDDDEEDGEKKEQIPELRRHVREKESGMVACRLWVRHYGNSRCEGMCCSLEAVGGRVAACMGDLPLTKENHPVPRNRMLDTCAYAWNSIESVILKFFNYLRQKSR